MRIAFTNRDTSDKKVYFVEEAWGLLPNLRLGQMYFNLKPQKHLFGKEVELRIDSPFALYKATNVLPKDLYGQFSASDSQDWFLTAKSDKGMVALSVTEAIRAILCPFKELAYGVVEASYLQLIFKKVPEVIDGTLRLEFSEDIPPKLVQDHRFLIHLGRILTDASFKTAWNEVARNRLTDASESRCTWDSEIPLRFNLPSLRPDWRVRALSSEKKDVLLILEILEVTPIRYLGFSHIEYSHPEISPGKLKLNPDDSHKIKTPVPAELRIVHDDRSAKRRGYTYRISKSAPPLKERQHISTRLMGMDEVPDKERPTIIIEPDLVPAVREVSLGEQRLGGSLPPAEFQHDREAKPESTNGEDLKEVMAEQLSAKIQALESLQSDTVSISWYNGQLAKTSAFTICYGQPRQFLLAEIGFAQIATCWLLEFDLSDSRKLSTLVFFSSTHNELTTFDPVVQTVINQTLLPQGQWNLEKLELLESLHRIQIKRFTHRQNGSKWAEKGLAVARALAGLDKPKPKKSKTKIEPQNEEDTVKIRSYKERPVRKKPRPDFPH